MSLNSRLESNKEEEEEEEENRNPLGQAVCLSISQSVNQEGRGCGVGDEPGHREGCLDRLKRSTPNPSTLLVDLSRTSTLLVNLPVVQSVSPTVVR